MVLALEEAYILHVLEPRVKILISSAKLKQQMFLLRHSCHVCVPPKGTNIASPYKVL